METELVIRARDLDTDAESRTTLAVVAPVEPDRQRVQLIDAVRARHPSARFRSFANAAATFLDRQHLIVAHYADPLPRRAAPAADPPQERLFAA